MELEAELVQVKEELRARKEEVRVMVEDIERMGRDLASSTVNPLFIYFNPPLSVISQDGGAKHRLILSPQDTKKFNYRHHSSRRYRIQ